MTAKRRSRPKETTDYLKAVASLIRAGGRRCAEADEVELKQLVELRDEVDAAVEVAVAGWLAMGRSFTDVGRALGVSRQAALKRWGHLQPR